MFRVNRPQTRLFRITTAELFQRHSVTDWCLRSSRTIRLRWSCDAYSVGSFAQKDDFILGTLKESWRMLRLKLWSISGEILEKSWFWHWELACFVSWSWWLKRKVLPFDIAKYFNPHFIIVVVAVFIFIFIFLFKNVFFLYCNFFLSEIKLTCLLIIITSL